MTNGFEEKHMCGRTAGAGEVGYQASDNNTPPANNDWICYHIKGNDDDLEDFVNLVLPAIRDCGVAGFAWWYFQDSYNADPQFAPLCNSDYGYGGNFEGIIEPGDPVGGSYPTNLRKTNATATFKWAASAPCTLVPSATYNSNEHYYNPFLHPPNQNGKTITGYVKDMDGNPIAGAVVGGRTDISGTKEDYHYTYTDVNGYFEIIPYDYEPTISPNTNDMKMLIISAPGCERAERGYGWNTSGSNSSNIDVTDGETFNLKKSGFAYDESISNIIVDNGNPQNFSGWNSLTTTDFTVEPYGESDLVARGEVNLLPGFDANYLSEVHIYNTEIFPDCPVDPFLRPTTHNSNEHETSGSKEIELSFVERKDFNFEIIPNPNTGEFRLAINNVPVGYTQLTVKDMVGNTVFNSPVSNSSTLINLSFIAKGIYTLSIKSENGNQVKKIIIR